MTNEEKKIQGLSRENTKLRATNRDLVSMVDALEVQLKDLSIKTEDQEAQIEELKAEAVKVEADAEAKEELKEEQKKSEVKKEAEKGKSKENKKNEE